MTILNKNNLWLTAIYFTVSILLIYFIKYSGNKALFVLTGLLIINIVFIIKIHKNIYFSHFVIYLFLIPLAYLNNNFHYWFNFELLLSVPLLILLGYSLILYGMYENSFKISNKYILRPLMLFIPYTIFSALVGLYNGNSLSFIIVELFHIFYYSFAFIIFYLFQDLIDYRKIFNFLLFVFIIMSIQYIYWNTIGGFDRFVTFQSGFFPMVIGILISFALVEKSLIKKAIFLILSLSLLVALYLTLTRSLWVTQAIVLFGIFYFFIFHQRKNKYLKN